MFDRARNMVAELHQEELLNATDRHIISVTLPDVQHLTRSESISEDCYKKPFPREPSLNSAQFHTY